MNIPNYALNVHVYALKYNTCRYCRTCSAHVGETNKLIKLIKLLQIKVMIKFNPDQAGYDKMFHIPGISYNILCM